MAAKKEAPKPDAQPVEMEERVIYKDMQPGDRARAIAAVEALGFKQVDEITWAMPKADYQPRPERFSGATCRDISYRVGHKPA